MEGEGRRKGRKRGRRGRRRWVGGLKEREEDERRKRGG